MKMRIMLFAFLVIFPFVPASGEEHAPAAIRHVAERTPASWVFFRDKGVAEADLPAAIERAQNSLAPRAIARRAKVRESGVSVLDVPLHEPYVAAVESAGARIRARSRWLNAVSVDATPAALESIRALACVASIQPVAAAPRREPFDVMPVELGPLTAPPGTRALNYGHCASQLLPIQVNLLHDFGLSGAGVLVCILDTGFWRTHQALDQVNVVAEHDFINDDDVTSNETGDDPGQHDHGTACLSILGGFDPGNLIGPAYGASFILGKTEDITSETPVEEDYWIEAAEWAEGLGADVISSSLSYLDWYVYEDMDGNTAPITIAADLAAQNGICVVTAAGNQGNNEWFYIAAPADGDSVIAAGAVDSLGVIASFSSHGPTADGRTKPDVCAMGRGNFFATTADPAEYARGSGTSFSCPLVAGVAALLLEAQPSWGPMQVGNALRATASRSFMPDNDYGWGVIRGWNAAHWGVSAAPGGQDGGASMEVAGLAIYAAPNPMHDRTTIRWSSAETPVPHKPVLAAEILDVGGRRVRALNPEANEITWDGRDERGTAVPAGIYFARVSTAEGSASARIVRLR